MAVTATGSMSTPLEALRTLVSESTVFQARVGAATAAAAKTKIHLSLKERNEGEPDLPYPFAVVALPDDWGWDSIAGGDKVHFAHTGKLMLYLADTGRYPGSPDDETLDFGNFIGGVIDHLVSESGVDDNLVITGIEMAALQRNDIREGQPYSIWEAAFTLTYGDR